MVEPRDGVRADGARVVAHDVHLGKRRHRGLTPGGHAKGRIADGRLQSGAPDGLVDAFVKCGRPGIAWPVRRSLGGGGRRTHLRPAFRQHLGEVLTFTVLPFRCSPPAMCIRQLTSVATSVSAPLASMFAILRSRRLPDTSLNFTANRPPKPQQVSASGSGQRGGPQLSEHASAWRATPRPRKPARPDDT